LATNIHTQSVYIQDRARLSAVYDSEYDFTTVRKRLLLLFDRALLLTVKGQLRASRPWTRANSVIFSARRPRAAPTIAARALDPQPLIKLFDLRSRNFLQLQRCAPDRGVLLGGTRRATR